MYIARVAAALDEPLVLLPPSEGKASGGSRGLRGGPFSRSLARPRADVRRALASVLDDAPRAARVLAVRGALLDGALEAYRELVTGRPPQLPAWQRYTGVVWEHLDPSSLTFEQRQRILVPSGLYGITTADDPIADFRLKLSVSLGGIGNLATFWRPSLTRVLGPVVAGRTVVMMLPKEHAAAIDCTALAKICELIEVRFVDRKGSRSVGHAAKAVKGVAARALLDGGLPELETLRSAGWTATRSAGGIDVIAP